jgi:hypothetical protein
VVRGRFQWSTDRIAIRSAANFRVSPTKGTEKVAQHLATFLMGCAECVSLAGVLGDLEHVPDPDMSKFQLSLICDQERKLANETFHTFS